jgi:hypothetical protein
MMSTLDSERLETYRLSIHGDSRERQWGFLLSEELPEYERFWQKFIVPLTNRIDRSILMDDHCWIGFRSEIPERFQRLAITHYSVFYYLARVTVPMRSQDYVFVEDVLHLLDSCADNVKKLFEAAADVLQDFDRTHDFLPKSFPPPDDPLTVFRRITRYRDVILHNPVLGRILRDGKEFLPEEEQLEEVKYSWKKAWTLGDEKLIEKNKLLAGLRSDLIDYLKKKWALLISEMEQVASSPKFSKVIHLERFLPIPPAPPLPTTSQPVGASGGTLRASPQARDIIILSSNTTDTPPGRADGG